MDIEYKCFGSWYWTLEQYFVYVIVYKCTTTKLCLKEMLDLEHTNVLLLNCTLITKIKYRTQVKQKKAVKNQCRR